MRCQFSEVLFRTVHERNRTNRQYDYYNIILTSLCRALIVLVAIGYNISIKRHEYCTENYVGFMTVFVYIIFNNKLSGVTLVDTFVGNTRLRIIIESEWRGKGMLQNPPNNLFIYLFRRKPRYQQNTQIITIIMRKQLLFINFDTYLFI